MKRPKPGWHRADIMAAIRKKNSNLARLGRETGLTRSSMSWSLMKPHVRANEAISAFLGVPMHVLWPNWFDRKGARIPAGSASATATRPANPNREQSPRQAA